LGVRVRVRLRLGSRSVEASALVNSGFETEEPEIVLPPALAQALGLEPSSEVSSYSVAGGGLASAFRAAQPVRVELVVNDCEAGEAEAVASIMPGESEVIISDRLAHELGIVILDPYTGEWCLRRELGTRARSSAKPEYWGP